MDDCNSCGKINSNPLKEGMTATAPWKNKQPKFKKNGSNCSWDYSNLQREKCLLGTTISWINTVFNNLLFRYVFLYTC